MVCKMDDENKIAIYAITTILAIFIILMLCMVFGWIAMSEEMTEVLWGLLICITIVAIFMAYDYGVFQWI